MARPLKVDTAVSVVHPYFFGCVNFPGSLTKFLTEPDNIVTILCLQFIVAKISCFRIRGR